MPNTFERITATGSSAGATLGTVPVGATWVIIGFMASNIAGYQAEVTVTAAGKSLVKDVPLPAGSSLPLLDGKLVLLEGDTIEESCSVDAGVDFIISYMEMT